MSIIGYLICILIAMIVGVPISISIGIFSIIYIFMNQIPINIIVQQLMEGVNGTSLLAIPLFILAGDIMTKGGMAKRILRLASAMVGNITGGLPIVAIMGCMFFAAISGSGIATAAAMSSMMIPAMVKSGYPKGFSSTVIATASPIGVIIPPSISFIIYGSITGTSVADLYKAGIPAGILMGIGLIIVAYFVSRKNNYQSIGQKSFSYKELFLAFRESIWALITPLILVGGVFGGIFTPTESAVVAVIYSLAVAIFIYKDMKWREIPFLFLQSAKMTSSIMFIIANASLFAWVLIHEQIPQILGNYLFEISESKFIILLLITVFILILGAFLETASILIIVVPLFLPIVMNLGLNPVHFGILVTMNTAIGLVTPPFGVSLFTTSSVSNTNLVEMLKHLWLPLFVMIFVLILITYFPQLVMFLV